MEKSLKTIQVLAKIGKVLSTIAFVCALVGGILTLVGLISLAAGADAAFKLGGITVYSIIENKSGMTHLDLYGGMLIGLVFCIVETVLAKFAQRYFRHELEAGTPFTMEGAAEIRQLGLLSIFLSIGSVIAAGIIYGIISSLGQMTGSLDINQVGSVGMGVAFLCLSVIFKYGAEMREHFTAVDRMAETESGCIKR